VRQVAQRDKEARFTALLHHVSLERLVMAYRDLSPKAAPGVDGVAWAAYGPDLVANRRTCTHGCSRGAAGRRRAGEPLRPRGIITGGHDNKTDYTVAIRHGEAVNAPALMAMSRHIIANNRVGRLPRAHVTRRPAGPSSARSLLTRHALTLFLRSRTSS
jgi:hypothetical protein